MIIKFKKIKSVNNPNSIHGIYPYRGKISAIEAEQVIKQLPKKKVLLDPFCGSGTILYEAQKYDLRAIGVDNNPLAIDLARGKIFLNNKSDVKIEVEKIVRMAKKIHTVETMPKNISRHFHKETAEEIMKTAKLINEMSDYVKAAFYGAIALTARGCNQYKWTSSTVGKDINPKRRIDFYNKFIQKTNKHFHPTSYNGSKAHLYDSRKISQIIKPNTVDYIFTSPPYFDCLDYTAYYAKIIYGILGIDRLDIRGKLIQNYKNYKKDMRKVLEELYTVCKKGATIIFVVGDKKIHGKVVKGSDFFSSISPFNRFKVIERKYSGSSSQIFDNLNKTQRKEQIIIWNK